MIKVTKLFFSPFKSMHMTEADQLHVIPNIGIEGDRVFCFTRFLDQEDALRFQEDRKARNIINFLSMKHSPILNHYHFSIKGDKISLFKLKSLKDFNTKTHNNIDLERFRGNIYIEGLEPFEEFKWIGKTITINEKKFEV